MANKQYISIIRLFNHCGISSNENFNLSRAKKHLQAEFRIARGGFINVDDYTYTSHDVFEEIERPDFLERLHFHQQIWNSPQILQWLEKNSVDLATIDNEFVQFWSNKSFDEFFSPYFIGPFNYMCRTLLLDNRLNEMSNLLFYEGFLQPDEREEGFRSLRVYLEENFRILRNVNGENYKLMRPKIKHWIDTDWHLFFNHLPDEFYELKNDMTTHLVNIGVAVQKTHRRDCRRMSAQLIALAETPESLRSTIVSNHAVYSRSFGWGNFSWGRGFGIFWIFIMLVRAVSGGCNDDTPEFQQFTPQFYPNDSTLKILTQKDSFIIPVKDKKVNGKSVLH